MERLPPQEPERLTPPEWDQLAHERLGHEAGTIKEIADVDSEEYLATVTYFMQRNQKDHT